MQRGRTRALMTVNDWFHTAADTVLKIPRSNDSCDNVQSFIPLSFHTLCRSATHNQLPPQVVEVGGRCGPRELRGVATTNKYKVAYDITGGAQPPAKEGYLIRYPNPVNQGMISAPSARSYIHCLPSRRWV